LNEVMRYYWFDHELKTSTSGLKNFQHLAGLFQATKLSGVPKRRSEPLNHPATFLVHPGEEGTSEKDWEGIANPNEKHFIIFVSSSPAGLKSTASGVHCVKHDLAKIIPLLTPEKVDKLKKSLREGTPEWELLRPPPFPEYLLAAYLVQAVAKNGVYVNPEESGCANFWNKAQEEFDQHAAQEGEVPEFTPDGDPSKLKSLLESIARGS